LFHPRAFGPSLAGQATIEQLPRRSGRNRNSRRVTHHCKTFPDLSVQLLGVRNCLSLVVPQGADDRAGTVDERLTLQRGHLAALDRGFDLPDEAIDMLFGRLKRVGKLFSPLSSIGMGRKPSVFSLKCVFGSCDWGSTGGVRLAGAQFGGREPGGMGDGAFGFEWAR
jgi:hypothetical protein